MPKIDFYILPASPPKECWQFVCRLIEKIYQQKHRIYIHTQDRMMAHQLDEMLWTYRDDSFLPHNLYGEGPEPAPPIQIGFNASTTLEKQRDVLLNLSQEVPSFHTQFSRLLELVMPEQIAQQAGRERYRFYRAHRFEINTHKLAKCE